MVCVYTARTEFVIELPHASLKFYEKVASDTTNVSLKFAEYEYKEKYSDDDYCEYIQYIILWSQSTRKLYSDHSKGYTSKNNNFADVFHEVNESNDDLEIFFKELDIEKPPTQILTILHTT